MSDAVRNVTIRVGLDFTSAKSAALDFGSAGRSALSSVDKAIERQNKSINDAAKTFNSAATAANRFGDLAADAGLRAGAGFKRAAEGAFTLARGVAFLTSDSEENLHAMIEKVSKIQGAFDVFKGTIDTIGGVSVVLKALDVTSQATAVTTTRLAAAEVAATEAAAAQATATNGATAAVGRLGAAAGPVGIAIATVAAVGTAAFIAWRAEEERLAAAIKKSNEELDDTRQKLEKVRAAEIDRHEAAARGNVALANLGFQSIDAAARAGRPIDDLVGSSKRVGADAMDRAITEVMFNSPDMGFKNDVRQRIVNTGQITAEDIRNSSGSDKSKIAALEGVSKALEAEISSVEKINELKDRGLQLLDDEKRKMDSLRDAAAGRVEEEQKRIGLQAEIGRLGEIERSELEGLAGKAKKGEQLTPGELHRAEELAPSLTGKFVRNEFAEMGQATLGKIQDAFTVQQSDIEKIFESRKKASEDLANKIEQQGQRVAQEVAEGWESILEILNQLRPMRDQIRRIEHDMLLHKAEAPR